MELSRQNSFGIDNTKFEQIIARLEAQLRQRPNDKQLVSRLITLLDSQSPLTSGNSTYARCQRALNAHYQMGDAGQNGLSSETFISNYTKWKSILDDHKLNTNIVITQLFEGNRIRVNDKPAFCGTYLEMFKKTGVISGLCFSCYKVQILPVDLVSFMQLYFILRTIKLERDNCRKCMVELRDLVPYPYKGYIFCESEEEAINCLHHVQSELQNIGLDKVHCGISHGCSEYGLRYPDFKYSGDGKHRSFERSESWQALEREFLAENPPVGSIAQYLSNNEITVRDMIGFETWIKYAEMIGDESYKQLLGDEPLESKMAFFSARVAKQADLRQTQLTELRERQFQQK